MECAAWMYAAITFRDLNHLQPLYSSLLVSSYFLYRLDEAEQTDLGIPKRTTAPKTNAIAQF